MTDASVAPAEPLHLLGVTLEQLQQWFEERKLPRYRAAQLLDWIYRQRVDDFAQMSNLPLTLREALATTAQVWRSTVAHESRASDETRKLLLTLPDGANIETVWIPATDRNTVCVSSQVGCPVGCRFCASGVTGVERSLTPGEIVEQVIRVERLIAATADPDAPGTATRLTNVVFMGMGEPLANYDAVLQAIRILNAPWGPNIGARRITVSTVGLPKQIRRLAEEGLQLNLALSLHAPDEALRQRLIPWGKVPLADLLGACHYYFEQTGREITLEYVLLAEVNDEPHHAQRLADIARRLRCNINLLRYNPVAGLPFARPDATRARAFQQTLRDLGINAHLRKSRGRDVDAACGQLRRRMSGAVAPESTGDNSSPREPAAG